MSLVELEQNIFSADWHSDYSQSAYVDFLQDCKDAHTAVKIMGLSATVVDPLGREWIVND